MKVLHFKTKYLNLSETFIDRLIKNHQKFTPFVATCYASHYTENVKIYSMPTAGLRGLLNKINLKINRTPPFLYNVVSKERPSLIHGHFGLDSYRLLGLKKYFGLPLVVNFYGYDVIRLPNEYGWKRRYKKLAREGDLFIAGSEDMKRNLLELGFPESNIRILKLGMDVKSIAYEERTSAGPKLMMVGRMVEKKGFTYAIDAIKILKNKNIDVTLDLYGDGKLRKNLEQKVNQLSLQNAITFHGQKTNDVIIHELYKHDILLVPSVQAKDGDREGIPQTTVEGMATGIPVIASQHAGLPELVIHEKTGLSVPEHNPGMIAKAVERYLNEPQLAQRISKSERQFVEKNHNIHTLVNQLEKYYKHLIEDA